MFIADLHLHSKYSRATSRDMDLENLNKWAKIKGINLLGSGDFTHPLWLRELKTKLEPAENGFFKLRGAGKIKLNNGWHLPMANRHEDNEPRFVLTSEVSCIYSKKNRTRKIHLIIFLPSFEAVEKFNAHLGWIGNLKADGRPILGIDAKEILKIALGISQDALVVPAHIWTPHFSLFGSESGFDSVEECFEELSRYIFAMETGLSSDPAMNWRWSALDSISLVSNSDAHSPVKLGREANIFEGKIEGYKYLIEALRLGVRAPSSVKNRLVKTIEFFPEEGKYHFDGHRNCQIVWSPEETKKNKGICPVCQKKVTIGVMNRVAALADRPLGGEPKRKIPFLNLIPLAEIIGEALNLGVNTKGVEQEYKEMINRFGSEFKILVEVSEAELRAGAKPVVAEGILRMRQGKVKIEPGYDGEYGKIKIFGDGEQEEFSKQKTLF